MAKVTKDDKSKEDQQGRILEYQHFELKSLKFNSSKGLDLIYVNLLQQNVLEEPTIKEVTHPDLNEKLDQLKLYYATKLGILEGWDFAREYVKKDTNTLQLAINHHKETIERVNVTGISFDGEGETYGVTIKGYMKFPKKGGSGLSSGKITFGVNTLGYEDDVMTICEEVKKEVYAYRFQNKKAQLDIETEAKKKEGEIDFDEDKKDA